MVFRRLISLDVGLCDGFGKTGQLFENLAISRDLSEIPGRLAAEKVGSA
jgi:hypothetical protein